jgi:hypothetical protein
MSVVTLRANSHLAIPVYGGLLTGQPAISYHVESEHPTHVFAIAAASLDAFRAGQDYRYWGVPNAANLPATNHAYNGPNMTEPWYLIIVNYNQWPTAVYHRVPA